MQQKKSLKDYVAKYLTVINVLEIGSMLFALGVITKVLIQSFQVPEGVCPVDNNRPLLYFSILLLIVVNLGTFGYTYWKKRTQSKNN